MGELESRIVFVRGGDPWLSGGAVPREVRRRGGHSEWWEEDVML